MNFAVAMANVLQGREVRRLDWNRPRCIFRSEGFIEGKVVAGIWMEMRDGRLGAYTPSQCDMLAEDWVLSTVAE